MAASAARTQAECTRIMTNSQSDCLKITQEANLYQHSIFNEANDRYDNTTNKDAVLAVLNQQPKTSRANGKSAHPVAVSFMFYP